jgi:hypothetical protein
MTGKVGADRYGKFFAIINFNLTEGENIKNVMMTGKIMTV